MRSMATGASRAGAADGCPAGGPAPGAMCSPRGRTACVDEVLVLVSFLSIQDPRERPAEKAEAADARHALFADDRSDFIGVLNLWAASREPAAGGNRVLRHWCRENFLSFVRMREWADLREQLAAMSRSIVRVRDGKAAPPGLGILHQTLLTGFLGGIGVLDEARTYLGARDTRFVIAPGTPLQKRSPHWIVAASLVETHRLYARMVAQVQPSWIEAAGAHLVKRTYGEAEWDARRGMAFAKETVALYGRVLSSGRRVSFAGVDPLAAQRMFVEEALVRRQPAMPFAFLERNSATRVRLERVEACLRRRDLLAGDDALVRFYLERIPPALASTRAFEKWWRTVEHGSPHALDADESVFLLQPLPTVRASDYPTTFDVQGNALHLHYRYDTAAADDGIALDLPLPLLRAFDAQRLEWLIPGWLREKVIALLRGLPKDVRREIVPIPDFADRMLAALPEFGTGSLFAHVAAFVTQEAGIRVEPGQLASVPLAPWLSVNIRVLDEAGRLLRASRDLAGLREEMRQGAGTAAFTRLATEDSSGSAWGYVIGTSTSGRSRRRFAAAGCSCAPIPASRTRAPACDCTCSPRQAVQCAHRGQASCGWRRWRCPSSMNWRAASRRPNVSSPCSSRRRGSARNCSARLPTGPWPMPCSARSLNCRGGVSASRRRWTRVVPRRRRRGEISRTVKAVLTALKDVRAQLGLTNGAAFAGVRSSINDQLGELLAPGWVRDTPAGWWHQLPKYVRAVARRLERARGDVERDRKLQAQVEPFEQHVRRLRLAADLDMPSVERERLRWMVEEYRLSLFAQDLRTLLPVSAKRLDEQLQLALREAAGTAPVDATRGNRRG